MKIMVGVAHPKHVHIFRNFVRLMIERGHEIKIIAIDKDVTEQLLKRYELPYTLIGKNQPNLTRKGVSMIKREFLTFKIAKKFKPDIFIGRAFPELAHVSTLLKKPFIVFEDTEIAKIAHKLTIPFTDSVVTPFCYRGDFGEKHVRFNGYFELAYLHPNYYEPDPSVLEDLGLSKDDKFVILRFVSWEASHDKGDRGFTNKEEAIKTLEQHGRILITSEKKLPHELEKYKINTAPEKIHHILYFSDLYVGESATMASESAILGTPAIFVSTSRRGYTDDLGEKYGLVFTFTEPNYMQGKALIKAIEILKNKNSKNEWQNKREELLKEKIDVTAWMIDFIENYPESFYRHKNIDKEVCK